MTASPSDTNITPIAGKRESIAAGVIVELKSGGPPMTVKVRGADEAYCIWHNADGDMFKDWVPVSCLKVKT